MVTIERKERDKQIRRNDILAAAEKVFAAHGFHNASVSEIAKEAQYATGTVYLYFKDKEDIYGALIMKGMDDFFSRVREKTGELSAPVEKLRSFLVEKFRFFEEHRDFLKLYLVDTDSFQSAFSGERRKECLSKHMLIVDLMASIFTDGIAAGIFKPADPKELAVMFAGLSNYLMMKQVFDGNSEPIENKAGLVMETFLNGCAVRRGSYA